MRRTIHVRLAVAMLAVVAVVCALPVTPASAAPRSGALRFSALGRGPAFAKLVLRRRGGEIVLLRAGSRRPVAAAPLAGTSMVSVRGEDGHVDNTLTVDLAGGALALAGGIRYDGGHGGYNTLAVAGGRAAGETSVPSGPHSGWLDVGPTRIRYTDIAPITDTTPATNYTFNAFAAGGIAVTDGPVVSGAQTLQIASTTSPAGFETTLIANKVNITLSGGSASNAFDVNLTALATGQAGPLDINGYSGGSNTITIEATPAGGAVAYSGASGDAVTIGGAGGTESVAGDVSVGFPGSAGSLTFDDSADTTGRTAVLGVTSVSGLTPQPVTYAQTSQLTVDGGLGSDTFDVTPSASTADSIVGGAPARPAFPGDQLNMSLTGATSPTLLGTSGSAGAQGAWLFANMLPVSFREIDSLDPTAASIADTQIDPGTSGAQALFAVTLLAPDPNPVQVAYATADGTATSAAGNYQAASGTLTFAPGESARNVGVTVPGAAGPAPTRTFSVGLTPVGSVQVERATATGTILNSNAAQSTTSTEATVTKTASVTTTVSVTKTTTLTTTSTRTVTGPGSSPAVPPPDLGLPANTACVAGGSLALHLRAPTGKRIARFTLKLDGHRVTGGAHLKPLTLSLASVKRRRFTITLSERTAAGRTLVETLAYRRC